jgi:hypothetical protein
MSNRFIMLKLFSLTTKKLTLENMYDNQKIRSFVGPMDQKTREKKSFSSKKVSSVHQKREVPSVSGCGCSLFYGNIHFPLQQQQQQQQQ